MEVYSIKDASIRLKSLEILSLSTKIYGTFEQKKV